MKLNKLKKIYPTCKNKSNKNLRDFMFSIRNSTYIELRIINYQKKRCKDNAGNRTFSLKISQHIVRESTMS